MAVTTVVKITHADSQDYKVFPSYQPREQVQEIVKLLSRIEAGNPGGASVDVTHAGTAAAQAAGTITLVNPSGTLTATVNGVAITAASGADATASATALAAAINASTNALVAGIVTASSSLGVVTIRALQRGKVGNAITLAASGTGATASGARLTGGAGDDSAYTLYSL